MYPHERSLVRTLADKPFAIIGVNSDKFPNVVEKVCKPKNISWPSFTNVQGDKKISDAWKVSGWPTTYLIDKDGIIRYKGLRGSALDAAIEELMAEMDIEVDLGSIDHEAEDEEAMEAYREALKAAESEDADEDEEEPEATKTTSDHDHDHSHEGHDSHDHSKAKAPK